MHQLFAQLTPMLIWICGSLYGPRIRSARSAWIVKRLSADSQVLVVIRHPLSLGSDTPFSLQRILNVLERQKLSLTQDKTLDGTSKYAFDIGPAEAMKHLKHSSLIGLKFPSNPTQLQ